MMVAVAGGGAGCAAPGTQTHPAALAGDASQDQSRVGEAPRSMMPEINVKEARERLESGEGYVYLDVRTPEEFAEGHVPGAINVPVAFANPATGRLEANPDFVTDVIQVLDKDDKIIVGCRSGGRSAMALEQLIDAGYSGGVNLMGGFHGKTDMTGTLIAPGWTTLAYPVCGHGPAGCKQYEATK